MDESTRITITAAAVNAAGPVSNYTTTGKVENPDGTFTEVTVPDPAAYQVAVHENAINIAVMAGEKGLVGKALAGVVGPNTKIFSGTVVGVRKEASSTRGLITLHTGTDREKEGLPAGCEQVRTERTDNPIGKSVALKARNMLGHRVLVYVEVEEINGGQSKVRVLRHVESLGVDNDAASKGLGSI